MKDYIIDALLVICLLAGTCLSKTIAKSTRDANQSLLEGNVIATVLGKNISGGDIEPSAEMIEKNKSKMTEKEFNQWLKQYRESRLCELIGRPLWDKYARENNIDVNNTEIEEFSKAMNQNMARTAAQWRQARSNLAKELENPDVNETQKEEIKSRIKKYDSTIQLMEKGFKITPNEPAQTMIRIWKVNKSLFEKYGGRVIFQQAGPEPLDAYRSFLKQQEAAGNFEIKDKQTSDLFWNYFTNDKMHTFYKDPNEAKKFMETPWWLMEPNEPQTKPKAQLRQECMKRVADIVAKIKQGQTRQEIEKYFHVDGGISRVFENRYVFKDCPFIKIKVEFQLSDPNKHPSKNDEIISISKPYFEEPFYD